MGEKESTAQRGKRQNFRMNLEAFPNVVKFFGRSKLEDGFQPGLYMQETCIVHYFSVPQPVALKYLDDALAELASIPEFTTKAKNLAELRTNGGFAEFDSVLLELWFAAQLARHGLLAKCEPETADGHRAEFKVVANGVDVYFEVRNLEPSEWVTVGLSSHKWPRHRVRKLEEIIRQAFYQFPYPYMVDLQPYDLSGDQQDFEADVQVFLTELRDLLRDIHQSKVAHPKQPIRLPRDKPRLTVLSIRKLAGLGYAWLGCGEYSVNRLRKLATAAGGKIEEKGPQLAPDAANVLVVGLPVWAQDQAFAEELLGPLMVTDQKVFLANRPRVSELGKKIEERVSTFAVFLPADRIEFYPGWVTVVLNPLGWSRHPLPRVVEMVLTGYCRAGTVGAREENREDG